MPLYDRLVRGIEASLKDLGPEQVVADWQVTPEVPEYLVDHFEKVLLTLNLLGRATFWQDLMDRGLGRWAKKQREIPAGMPDMALSETLYSARAGAAWAEFADLPPLGIDKAHKFFADKVPLTRTQFDELSQLAATEAFTIAGTENIALIAQVKEVAQRSLREGITPYEFRKEVTSMFEAAGVTATSRWHLETVFRTNVGNAYNAARWQQTFESPTETVELFVPFLQYSTTGARNVCPICAPYNGKIYKRDDPIWETIYPLNHYNCECLVAPVTVYEAEAEGLTPDTTYPDSPGPISGFQGPPSTLGRRPSPGPATRRAPTVKPKIKTVRKPIFKNVFKAVKTSRNSNTGADNFTKKYLDAKGISKKELSSISEYFGGDRSFAINTALRKAKKLGKYDKALVDNLTKTVGKGRLSENIVCYRGVGSGKLGGINITDLAKGDVIKDAGFVSTTLDKSYATKWAKRWGAKDQGLRKLKVDGVLLEIKAPKGTAGFWEGALNEYHHYESQREWELLLQRGSGFRVVGAPKKVGSILKLVVEIL